MVTPGSGIRTIEYPNGDIYKGAFLNGKRSGHGVLTYCADGSYEGEFANGLFHGYGIYTCKKYKYEGYYYEAQKQGDQGVQEDYENGDLFKGSFKNDVYDGFGVLVRKINLSRNGKNIEAVEKIVGEWTHGQINGDNICINYGNGDSYEGQMRFNLFHGNGKYSWAQDYGSYFGQFCKGKKHGVGVRVFSNGSKYVGHFFQDCIEGDGEMIYANDDRYKGKWLNNKPSQGEMKFSSNGNLYSGGFKNGYYYGRGKLVLADGSYYDGEFKPMPDSNPPDGLPNGSGKKVWTSSGNQYEGTWKNGTMYGKGVFISVQGRYEGFFVNNQKQGNGIETWKFCKGILPYPSLKWAYCPAEYSSQPEYCRYEGEYQNGLFHGKGKLTIPNGKMYEGDFFQGKRQGHGTAILLKNNERGNSKRMNVGKHGSFYRCFKYVGDWHDDHRHGSGTFIFLDGTEIKGFVNYDKLHGEVVYTYPKKKKGKHEFSKTKCGLFEHGVLKEWIK